VADSPKRLRWNEPCLDSAGAQRILDEAMPLRIDTASTHQVRPALLGTTSCA
jgi:hypothetical protein